MKGSVYKTAALVAALLLTLILAACGGQELPTAEGGEQTVELPSDRPTEEETTAPTEAPTTAPTEAPTTAPTEAPTTAPTEAPTAAPTEGGTVALEIESERPTYASVDEVYTGERLHTGTLFDTSGQVSYLAGSTVKLYDVRETADGVAVFGLSGSGVLLDGRAATALNALCKDAYLQTGMVPFIRTATDKTAASAGYADYATFLSVQVSYYDKGAGKHYGFEDAASTTLRRFFEENAAAYGFINLSTASDAGHFRYVGQPHALVMKREGLHTLDAYHAYLRSFAERSTALSATLDGKKYLVLYFEGSASSVTVKTPADKRGLDLTASATGKGGVVLTVLYTGSPFVYPLPYEAEADADREGYVICLDAGHGQRDPGATVTAGGVVYREKDVNLAVALKTAEYLRAMGYTVVLTRDDDTAILGAADPNYDTGAELDARVAYAKSKGTDLYISFHCNASDNTGARRPEVYYNGLQTTQYLNVTTARAFKNAWNAYTAPYVTEGKAVALTDNYVIGQTSGIFRVLRDTALPAVLLEMGFITNEADRALLFDADWQESIACGVASAVETLFANDQLGVK